MSTNTLTFDESPARRPGIDDVGGGQKENDIPGPSPVRHATAEDFNQLSQQAVAAGRMMPVARLSIGCSAGAYSLLGFWCPSSNPTTETWTITKNSTGVVSVSCPTGTLPSPAGRPRAFVVGTTPLMVSAEPTGHGAKVHMADGSGTPTDASFELDIF